MYPELTETIRMLQNELAAVTAAIATLEAIQQNAPAHVWRTKSTRGRKSMGSEERQQVSERMKRYWSSRRQAQQASTAAR